MTVDCWRAAQNSRSVFHPFQMVLKSETDGASTGVSLIALDFSSHCVSFLWTPSVLREERYMVELQLLTPSSSSLKDLFRHYFNYIKICAKFS